LLFRKQVLTWTITTTTTNTTTTTENNKNGNDIVYLKQLDEPVDDE